MNWPKLKTSWRRNISVAMISLAVVMLGDGIYQTWMHFKWQRWLDRYAAVASPTTQPATQPSTQPSTQPASQPASAPAKPDKTKPSPRKPDKPKPIELNAAIRKRNIFAPPKQRGHGLTLVGVMGNIALFKAGNDTVGIQEGSSERNVKVKSIDGYDVTIEFEGKQETMKLFAGSGPGGSGGPGGPPMPESGPKPPQGMPPAAAATAPAGTVIKSGAPAGVRLEPQDIPEELKQAIESRRAMRR